MAILTDPQLTVVLQDMARRTGAAYTKDELKSSTQAIEDWFVAARIGSLRGIVTAAWAPYIPTEADIDSMITAWLSLRCAREEAGDIS